MSAISVVENALPKSIRSEARRAELAQAITDALEAEGHLWEDGWVDAVEVHNARVITETIEVYGLTIQLDAHGNAVTVSSPHGFMVIA